ncbi:uncharacterized protein LOC128739246 [Sabethes cyaneus]|uniref:uncharacterized protein LOC128739246 n=1 Tax=Sabethes cyaneus TaxID=53552 RepID=UPI00237ECB9B|nr:uncharacterized protein LOC128739246 [Sabethes cyaneus]XP_053690692.1 uncharacterized protein LOC128739246 [Sabethes cyaneus]
MTKEIDYISDINEKYAAMEYELNEKLKSLDQKELMLSKGANQQKPNHKKNASLTLGTARLRNFELLRSLEVSKARLRSRATFSPLETILQKAIGNYLKESSLVPCTTRKAYGPTYV